jgi:uncharacterized membrane protein YjgN (DUF898 family)
MNGLIIALIVLAAAATAYVLIRGVITMAQGKDVSGEQSNKYMSMRVTFQMIAVLLVVLLLVIGGRGLNGG